MTTDSDRISRLEGIAERTNATLDSIESRLEGLHTDIGDLRGEMQAGDAALLAQMQAGDAALHADIQALGAKMDSMTRMMFFAAVSVGIALIGAIIALIGAIITFILRF